MALKTPLTFLPPKVSSLGLPSTANLRSHRVFMASTLSSNSKEVATTKKTFSPRREVHTQVTHSMPHQKIEIFKSLETWAEDNILPILKSVEDSWQPQDFLPDSSSEGFRDQVLELRERSKELPDDYFVCLVGDMITEEALPTYQTMLNTLDGVRDETGASLTSWGIWTRAWTAEENRHGDLLNKYLYLTGRVDMRQIEKTIQYLIGSGMDPKTENSPYLGFVYTSFQERATFISHGNTGRLAKEHGDIHLAKICGTIAADEKRHEKAYTKIVEKLRRFQPQQTIIIRFCFFFFFFLLVSILVNMAFIISNQLGSLCGTAVPGSESGAGTGEPAGVLSMRATSPSLRCRIQRQPGEMEGASPPLSPCRTPSPVYGARRADLSMACQAFVGTETALVEEEEVVVREYLGGGVGQKGAKGVPVYVMMPLDSVNGGHGVNRKKAMNASLQALKSAGVEGVMMDVWWGLVERDQPGEYNFGGYAELLEMCRKHGLKVQAVMSFHQCGGNVGDSCTIPLPRWVVEEMDNDPDLVYTDQWGRRNSEYISLGCDTLPVLKGRSPVQCYADFMRSFRDTFKHLLGDTIVEIQVGMGPAGELRYPSYPEMNGTWKFPGIGAFQCYDRYMISNLRAAAEAAGKPEWGHGGPSDAGHYNNWPEDTPFFRREGGWSGEYGEFFLRWYSQMLLDHGERILSAATPIFTDTGVKISVKVAGIHWHYGTRSHAPELTAGYYNTRGRDGYLPIARMLARHGAVFNFTCIEMRDHEQPQEAQCMPEMLVKQVGLATREAGVALAGENALPRYDETAHEQILNAAGKAEAGRAMCAFTYLRMGPELFHPENWRKFVAFVKRMGEGGEANRCREEVEREDSFGVPLVQEAAVALMHG